MKKYLAFEKILATIDAERPDWIDELTELEREAEVCMQGKTYELKDHIEKMILAMLSCQRRWQDLVPYIENGDISAAFCNFDPEILKKTTSDTLYRSVTEHNCGNRRIDKQVEVLAFDIGVLESMFQDNVYDIKHGFYSLTHNSDGSHNIDGIIKLIQLLAEGKSKDYSDAAKYKLKEMGVALVCEYLKGFGVNVVKPDTHVRRILGNLGYSKKQEKDASVYEAIKICDEIANEYSSELSKRTSILPPAILVDTIIWQYGAEGKAEICTKKNPKCSVCKAQRDCYHYKAVN